ncbi:Rieske [2Fe-2S] iron-sulfur domain-containing protein [Polychytrium aggregatum]|uniref:Rieske [2Fe-2S] iron-sulfur domain-containing protein n=1 Tax=Polychytrium aggregatum TaxID=110093 RepID=UPI0022FF2C8C|nr:Rieske [2Fe-2S] iron-sulfur domain-containing protein [Polychytrium aggregatum]KAI9206221.1 Rieske [2Fe-2S] iron-sulfur domain-containing protein [Polychytrium aggregatum]
MASPVPNWTQDEIATNRAFFYEQTTEFRKTWYPLVPSNELLTTQPTALRLLEEPLVLYRDPQTNQPVVFADKCAHRSAPLSVGRIMDGKLECRYHGWQYDTDGKVSHIPSLLKDRSIPANAKVQTYPAHEADGWVWVWPGTLEDMQDVPKPKLYHPWGGDLKAISGYVDLDIDHSLLLENFLDPSHLPFTHDTTIGNRKLASAMTIDCQFHGKFIRGLQVNPDCPENITAEFEFHPPILSLYCIPTRKGHCRFIYEQRLSFFDTVFRIPVVGSLVGWYFPGFIKKILMEDYAMLTGQQERLAMGANAMNSPVAADLMIKTYRNWWRKAMKKNPWFKGYSDDIEDIVLGDCHHSCASAETKAVPATLSGDE